MTASKTLISAIKKNFFLFFYFYFINTRLSYNLCHKFCTKIGTHQKMYFTQGLAGYVVKYFKRTERLCGPVFTASQWMDGHMDWRLPRKCLQIK